METWTDGWMEGRMGLWEERVEKLKGGRRETEREREREGEGEREGEIEREREREREGERK